MCGPVTGSRSELQNRLDRLLLGCLVMQGRITEKHLHLAEATFPGIEELYRVLDDKPATFLQLVWLYEGLCQEVAGLQVKAS